MKRGILLILIFVNILFAERKWVSFSEIDTINTFKILHPVDTIYSDSDHVIIKTSFNITDTNASGIRAKVSLPNPPYDPPYPFTYVISGFFECIDTLNEINLGLCDSSGKIFTIAGIRSNEIFYGKRINNNFLITSKPFIPEDSVYYRIMLKLYSSHSGIFYIFPENCNFLIDSEKVYFDSTKLFIFLGSIKNNRTLRYDFLFASNDEPWLRDRITELKPDTYNFMLFSGAGFIFNYGNHLTDSLFLDMFFEIDVDIISIRYTPPQFESDWFRSKWKKVAERIHNNGKLLAGIYEVDANTFSGIPSFDEYLQKEIEYSIAFCDTFNPEYFGVVVEPTTMEKERTGADFTESEWQYLVERVSDTLKKLFPEIKTFAVVHKLEFNYLPYFVNVNSLDIIGFNLYGNSMLYPDFYPYGDSVGRAMEYVSQFKEIWIWETWASLQGKPPVYPETGFITHEWWADDWLMSSDSLWIPMMVYYAQKYRAKNIMPFFTGRFIFYTQDTTEALDSLLAGARTGLFYSYKNIIKEIRQNVNIREERSDLNKVSLMIYPALFSGSVSIIYSIPKKEKVYIRIFSLDGSVIKIFTSEIKNPGIHRIFWDGKDLRGKKIPSGLYFINLKAEDVFLTKKVIKID